MHVSFTGAGRDALDHALLRAPDHWMPSPESLEFYGVDPGADFDAMPDAMNTYSAKVVLAQRELREPLYPGQEPVCFVGGYTELCRILGDGGGQAAR